MYLYIEQLENVSDYINAAKAHKSLYSASVSNVTWQLTSRSVVQGRKFSNMDIPTNAL